MTVVKEKKILLCVLPFWIPESPPLGIAVLKSHLQKQGFKAVHCYDFNAEKVFWALKDRYVKTLNRFFNRKIDQRFFIETNAMIESHLAAFVNQGKNLEIYEEFVEFILSDTFHCACNVKLIKELNGVVAEIFDELEALLLSVVEDIKPEIFGLSVFSASLAPSVFGFKLIRRYFPHIETLMGGGVFADLLELDSVNFKQFALESSLYIDKFLVGESELLLERYLLGDFAPEKRVLSLKDLGSRSFELNTAAIPDFSDFNLSSYLQLSTYTTRSCPFQCKFCSETVLGGQFRKKNIEQIVSELQALKNQYGRQLYILADSLLNPIILRLSRALLDYHVDVYWDGHLRIDNLSAKMENTRLWAEAGFYRARLGIESGSQRMLDLMKKDNRVEQIKRGIKALAEAGIKTTTFWIVGYPGETTDDVMMTLDLIEELKDYIYEVDWHPFVFFPNGQVNSIQWQKQYECELVYPARFNDLLLTRSWRINVEPGPEEVFERMNLYTERCKQLAIPTHLSSLMKIYRADQRWQKLRNREIPTMMDLLEPVVV